MPKKLPPPTKASPVVPGYANSIPSADERLMDEIAKYWADPLGYVMFMFPWDTEPSIQMVQMPEPWASRYNCKWGPDAWACEFLDALGQEIKERKFDGKHSVAPIRFTTASGHGIGKSVMVSWLIKFILDTRPFSKGVVTANTSEQLRTKTWAELAKWNAYSLTSHKWHYTSGRGQMSLYRMSPDKEVQKNWRCDAMTCREENAEAFQGLHAASSTPFYIFDEASGIPDKIWEARAGGATDGEPMSFDFGNPTRKSGFFYENCIGKFRHRYAVRSIDSRSVQITNKELMQEWIDDWGEDSDFVKVKVKGQFPSAGSVQFIPSDIVEDAMHRMGEHSSSDPLVIGVDVARFGENSTVIFNRLGYDAKSFPYKEYKGLDVTQVVDKVVETIHEFAKIGKKVTALYIDGGGLGGGVVDLLRRYGYNPIDINFGGKPGDSRYRFKSDEMWGKMKDALQYVALPNDPGLKDQLTQREYGFTPTGKIQLESKSDMKDRGVVSPDIADAFALTYAGNPLGEMDPSAILAIPSYAQHEYDPLEYKE